MSTISGNFDPRTKQIIIRCGVAKAGELAQSRKDTADSKIPMKAFNALIDTGANSSCISKKIVQELELQHHSMSRSATAGGVVECRIYDIDLILGFSNTALIVPKVQVAEAILSDNFDLILGMDIILQGQLHISHDHHFSFSI